MIIVTRPQIVNLGPFTNGEVSDSINFSVATKDLRVCQNFDLDSRGFLRTRPSLRTSVQQSYGRADALLYFESAANTQVIFHAYDSITATHRLITETNTILATGHNVSCGVAYAGLAFFLPAIGAGAQGGYLDQALAWTADVNMPEAYAVVAFKQRLFAIGKDSKVYFTDPINPAVPTPLVWNSGVNFFVVGFKDGDELTSIEIYNDSLILFKENSTWVFDYDADPAGGILRVLNTDIGAYTVGCTCSYENSLYVLHRTGVYEIINYTFTNLTVLHNAVLNLGAITIFSNVPSVGFTTTPITPVWICAVGDRILVRNDRYVHVFYPKARAWTTWYAAFAEGSYYGRLLRKNVTIGSNAVVYWGGSSASMISATADETYLTSFTDNMYNSQEVVINRLTTVHTGFDAILKTVFYDFDTPMNYKKILHWGVVATVSDSNLPTDGFRGAFESRTHVISEVLALKIDDIGATYPINKSVFRFLGGHRFQQISFNLTLSSGMYQNLNTVPAILYYLYAVVSNKAITEDLVD